jgi:predicted PurR-regulated permease PerM
MSDQTAAKPVAAVPALVAMAAFVIIVAGMRAASRIVVPFLLAVFVAILCAPIYARLRRWRVPPLLALVMMIVGVVLVLGGGTLVVGSSLQDFSGELPAYQEMLRQKTQDLAAWLEAREIDPPDWLLGESLNPGAAMGFVGGILRSMSGLLGQAFLIILTIVFILLEAAGMPDKIRAMPGVGSDTTARMDAILESVRQYMAIKTLTSAATGVLVAIALAIIGVKYPVMWGMLAFLFNFVPNIGSIIAAIPAVMIAILDGGIGTATWTAAAYLALNTVIGNVVEPKVMGRGLGLSTLVVFLSLVFWGWVLGPVGMLLSVPLTMAVKIVLEANEDTRWLAILLGSGPPPSETPAAAG